MWALQYSRLHPDFHPVIQTLILNLFLFIKDKFQSNNNTSFATKFHVYLLHTLLHNMFRL
jgi:hypothetical protein